MIYSWIISAVITGEVVLFLVVLWFRDRAKLYPPGWYYFALTLGMFVMANTSLFAYVDTLHRTETLRTIIARRIEVNSLMRAVLEMESSQRGYLLTDRDSYLDPYRRSEVDITARMEAVRSIYSGLPDGQYAEALCRTISMKVAEMDDVLATYRTGTPGKAIEVVKTDTGRNLMALCTDSYDDLLARNFRDYDGERSNMAAVARTRIAMAALLILGSVAQMILGAYRHHPSTPDEPEDPAVIKAISDLDLPKPAPRT